MLIPSIISAALLSLSSLSAPPPGPSAPTPAAQEDGGELIVLIENYVAPHFELSIDEAWYAYTDGTLIVKQLGEHHYLVAYGDGILDVTVDDGNF